MRRQADSKAVFTGPLEDYCMQAGGGETNKYSSELLRKALVSPLGVSFWRGDRPKPQSCGGQGVLSNVNFFFSFIFISWRLITLQYCSGFCHTLT